MNLTCYFLFTCFSFLFAAQVINLPTIQNVNLEEFPYQAQIVTSEETACSAIIISRNYIMTPATCIAESSSVKVYVGTKTKAKHLSKNILNTYGYNSSNFLFNGDDNTFWNFKYDIALIRIPQPLEFSAVIQKAKIKWDDVLLKENSMLQVSGWSNSDATFDLKKMEVKLAPEILCDYCYNAGETQKIISCFKQPGSNYLDYFGNIVELNGNVLGYLIPGSNGGICSKLVPFLNIANFAHWVETQTGIRTNTYDIDIKLNNIV